MGDIKNITNDHDWFRPEILNSDDDRPAYDCDICQDTGLVHAPIGYRVVTAGWQSGTNGKMVQAEIVIKAAPDGSPYPLVNIPCEACKPLRDQKQKIQYQALSGFTEDEVSHKLASIQTSSQRPGTTELLKAGRDIISDQAHMITVYGKTGNAKSLLLVALVNEFLDRGTPALYVRTSEMLNWIRDAFNPDRSNKEGGGSALERIDMLKYIRVLAIDEAGAIKQTDWTAQILDEILDRRYREALAGTSYTIIAMNEHPSILGDRIHSRMRDKRLRLNGSPIIENKDSDLRPYMERKQ